MENRRTVGLLNPMCDKIEDKNRGGERDDTSGHGLSRSWKVDVCEKSKNKIKNIESHSDDFVNFSNRSLKGY